MVGRFTQQASDCVAGVAINQYGHTKIFHFEFWRFERDMRAAGLYPEQIQFGLFSAGTQESLTDASLMGRYEAIGLSRIAIPSWHNDGHFGIMADYLNNELLYYFQNYDYTTDTPLPPFHA